MCKWKIDYYQDHRGRRPVEEYIDSLDRGKQANIIRVLELVEEFGISLGLPFMKQLQGKLWELRPGKSRILYFIHTGKTFVLLHGFTKKTRKTPRKEIQTALKRLKVYEKDQKNPL